MLTPEEVDKLENEGPALTSLKDYEAMLRVIETLRAAWAQRDKFHSALAEIASTPASNGSEQCTLSAKCAGCLAAKALGVA